MGEKNNKVIGIIDYGIGNINAFKNIYFENGIEIKVIKNIENLNLQINKIILPGVGSFDYAIQSLKNFGLLEPLKVFIKNQNNLVLGVCVGMQILCKASEEGSESGIGVFDQTIKKFRGNTTPHMGWNTIDISKKDDLLNEIPNESEFYFLHSYYFDNKNSNYELCKSNYNQSFSSIVKKNNIYGIQFHPEKSHKLGEKVLLNFHNIKC